MDTAVPFGEWLKRRRKTLDLTREKLAWRVGCSFETIKKIESGDLKPSVQLAQLMAAKLEVPIPEHEAFVQFARSETPMDAFAFTGLPVAVMAAPAQSPRPPLPTPLTSLLGRSREIHAAIQLLRRAESAQNGAVRLLTLSGPPGAGKTRLALAIATEIQGEFADGACFVPLEPVSDPAFVIQAIAQALNVPELNNQPLQISLQNTLRDKHLLLILDNFEQVIEAAPRVSELLQSAPELKIMITSREPLRVYGEQEFPVPPLELPDVKHLPPLEALSHYSSIQLFVARARAVKPDFELNASNGEPIARVCALLDGLPLAVEMAAAQTKRNSPARLLTQLNERLIALTGGMRDLSPRQQTLRGAIDWSYNLLGADEKRLFHLLSLFVGGADFDTLMSVSPEDAPSYIQSLEATLETLIDKSLVRREQNGDAVPRYIMLETLREYALEKLDATTDALAAHRRHAEYFLALAEQAAFQNETKPAETPWSSLEREHDNLRAALTWSLEHSTDPTALRLVSALSQFWTARGHWGEGLRWTERVLEQTAREHSDAGAVDTRKQLRAKAMYVAATLYGARGEYDRAREFHLASLAVRREMGDASAIVESLSAMAPSAFRHGARSAARAYCEEGLTLARDLDDYRHCALFLNHLGWIELSADNYTAAQKYLDEALQMSQALRDKSGAAESLNNLGMLSYSQGQYAAAHKFFIQSLALARELGDLPGERVSLHTLGMVCTAQGEWQEARRILNEGLALAEKLGEALGIARTQRALGYLALTQGNLAEARGFLEQALETARALGQDIGTVYMALSDLAELALAEGDYASARTLAVRVADHWREAGYRVSVGDQERLIAYCDLAGGNLQSARQTFARLAEQWRQVEHNPKVALALLDLAVTELQLGEPAPAAESFQHASTLAHELGDTFLVALATCGLGAIARAQGDANRAAKLFDSASQINPQLDARMRAVPKPMRETLGMGD